MVIALIVVIWTIGTVGTYRAFTTTTEDGERLALFGASILFWWFMLPVVACKYALLYAKALYAKRQKAKSLPRSGMDNGLYD